MSWNTHIPKFRRFVLQNFPFIEEDFDALTDYALICKVVEYLNQVIDSQNAVITEVSEFESNVNTEINRFETSITADFENLTNLFNQLQSFVENYFDNLDVQEEINTKLDAMVEDGTLESLISTQILGDLSTLKTNDKSSIVAAVNEVLFDEGVNIMNKYRKKYYSHWDEILLPSIIDNTFFDNFTIYNNGAKRYTVDFDRNKFINQNSTHTFYVATDGNNTTGDGSENNPYKTIYEAWKHCSSGDTIILKNGIYSRDGIPNSNSAQLTKSINIIGESEDGVWIKEADNHEWTQDSTYTNIYHTTRSGVNQVLDIQQKDKGIFFNLVRVYSKADCASTDNTYFIDGNDVYVNQCGKVVSDETIVLGLGLNSNGAFRCTDFTENTLIYLENINILQSNNAAVHCNNNTNYDVTLYIKNCKFYNNLAAQYTLDSISNKGCYMICENVVCNNTGKDGFNYHSSSTDKEAIAIEINCTSINCGYGQTESAKLSNNSTTAHNASQVVRVGGVYGYSNGGNVVDIDTVKSVCYGCIIFDSYYGRQYDMYAGGTATMYVYDCYFKGSKAPYNMQTNENSYIYYNEGTEFDTKSGANVLPIPTE